MQASAESQLLWWLALAAGALVVLVVATLLTVVLAVASAIEDEAQTIQQKASDIAVSTIQLLYALRINSAVASVAEGTGLILRQAGRLAVHVQSCQGCPSCVAEAGPPVQAEFAEEPSAGEVALTGTTGRRAAWSWS